MILEVSALDFAYSASSRRLADIGFDLSKGQVLCLIGPNGAGKTTLLRCLIGALKPSAGRVRLMGGDAARLSPRELSKRMAYVPQASQPAFGHRVREMVVMGRTPHLGRLSTPGKADLALAEQCLDQVGIAHLGERSFASVSGGERQLCLLARALAQQAPILVLDEPAASLDFGNQVRMLDIIARLAREGFAILMTTHHPDHALQVGSRFLALKEGRVVARGPVVDLTAPGFLTDLYDAPIRIIRDTDGAVACAPQITVSSHGE
jgi:iron complex transport system ATP-binding protein